MELRLKTLDFTIFNTSEGRLRLLSTVILAPMVIGVTYLGGAAYSALIALVAATGLYEWLRLVDPEAPQIETYALYGSLLFAVFLSAVGLSNFGVIVIAMAGVVLYTQRSTTNMGAAYWFALGLPYIAGSGIALISLRATPASGLLLTYYLFATVWGMDIGAYITGRLLGGPKLAPQISPNKTWAGFYGGIVLGAVLAACVLAIGHAGHFGRGLLVAMVLAAMAQVGDLFKSFLKRRAGVKDSGTLIPGHGGILDRIDGLIFSAITLAFLQAVFGDHLIW